MGKLINKRMNMFSPFESYKTSAPIIILDCKLNMDESHTPHVSPSTYKRNANPLIPSIFMHIVFQKMNRRETGTVVISHIALKFIQVTNFTHVVKYL